MNKAFELARLALSEGSKPSALEELKRLSREDLKFIVRRWQDIDPTGGVYTFPRKSWRKGPETHLLAVGMGGSLRRLSPEQIRDLAQSILDMPVIPGAVMPELKKTL